MLEASATTLHTSTSSATATATSTSTSPTRPSRRRGLSYLRSYTRDHLHSHPTTSTNREEKRPGLRRSTSSPCAQPTGPQRAEVQVQPLPQPALQPEPQSMLQPLPLPPPPPPLPLPTVQGRSVHTTAMDTESARPEPSDSIVGGVMAAAAEADAEACSSDPASPATHPTEATSSTGAAKEAQPTIRFIPHVEPRSTRPSLHFTTLSRTVKTPSSIVRVGRYSERDNRHRPTQPNTVLPVGFKSKVVSRRHCEFWCTDGQWYIKDVKSSSGTFLNHVRLSPPGQESRPYEVNDGDTVQLGIDFKGGEEVIFRCVKIRIECNRGWQKSLNPYNTSAHNRLLKRALGKGNRDSDAASTNSSECSICLNPVAPCQALFVAPCSHVWHYKCVRNLIHSANYPNFLCPNCRFVADLEADVEPPEEEDYDWPADYNEMSGDGEAKEGGDEAVEGIAAAGTREYDGGPSSRRSESGRRSESRRRERRDEAAFQRRDETDDTAAQQHSSSDDERRSPALDRTAHIADEELAQPLTDTSLNSSTRSRVDDTIPVVGDVLDEASLPTSSTSAPLPIRPSASSHRTPPSDLPGARSTTPTSNTPFALAVGVGPDGPVTPRNDAGPFVFDGSGGRGRVVQNGLISQVVAEESERGTSPGGAVAARRPRMASWKTG